MNDAVVVAGTKKPCCANDLNLRVVESNASLTVQRCIICGCRHYEAVAQTGRAFATPQG